MGTSIEKNKVIGCYDLVNKLVTDMITAGFVAKHSVKDTNDLYTAATLEAGVTVDSLAATQPWRIRIEAIDDYNVRVNVAHPLQLPDDGTYGVFLDGTSAGFIGDEMTGEEDGLNVSSLASNWRAPGQGRIRTMATDATKVKNFIDRDKTYTAKTSTNIKSGAVSLITEDAINSPTMNTSYPMSYRLSTSDHGIMLFVWDEGSDSKGNEFSWLCVQRSVDSQTGAVYTSGKSPVYCVYSCSVLSHAYIPADIINITTGSGSTSYDMILDAPFNAGIKKFIVRELDVNRPSPQRDACAHSEDSRAIINPVNQVAITEDNKYVITFPNGLNTPRYAYTHELDMLGVTSADVVSQWSEIPLTVYGESAARTYKAMCANGPNNTGMRILMIMEGPSTTPA